MVHMDDATDVVSIARNIGAVRSGLGRSTDGPELGETLLLAALIADAHVQALKGDASARAWIDGTLTDCPLPYSTVLDVLGLAPDVLPRGL